MQRHYIILAENSRHSETEQDYAAFSVDRSFRILQICTVLRRYEAAINEYSNCNILECIVIYTSQSFQLQKWKMLFGLLDVRSVIYQIV